MMATTMPCGRYAKVWRAERGTAVAQAYVRLSFAPGEAYQFDWSHEIVLSDGLPAVEAACAEALAHGVHSAAVVLSCVSAEGCPVCSHHRDAA